LDGFIKLENRGKTPMSGGQLHTKTTVRQGETVYFDKYPMTGYAFDYIMLGDEPKHIYVTCPIFPRNQREIEDSLINADVSDLSFLVEVTFGFEDHINERRRVFTALYSGRLGAKGGVRLIKYGEQDPETTKDPKEMFLGP